MIMTIDELQENFLAQYQNARQDYELEKHRIDNFDTTTQTMGRLDLTNLNSLRESCIKFEGALEAFDLVKQHVFGDGEQVDEQS